MKLEDFQWMPKSHSPWGGGQIVLKFGDRYELSIINDGYGRDEGLYEIAIFEHGSFARLPGISDMDDDVLGHLSDTEVTAIIQKLYSITGIEPTQV